MKSALDKLLLSVAPEKWKTRQVVVLDWHDGPREGVCELELPSCSFYFTIVAERWRDNHFDDRIFRLFEMDSGTIAEAMSIFQRADPPTHPVWTPHGPYRSEQEQHFVEESVDRMLSRRLPSRILVKTMDMISFSEIWMDTSVL